MIAGPRRWRDRLQQDTVIAHQTGVISDCVSSVAYAVALERHRSGICSSHRTNMMRGILSPAYYTENHGHRPSADDDLDSGVGPLPGTDGPPAPCHTDSCTSDGGGGCRVCAACTRGEAAPSDASRAQSRQRHPTPRTAHSRATRESVGSTSKTFTYVLINHHQNTAYLPLRTLGGQLL